MSGFEVAGAVLGAIPIALSALDGYKRAAKKVNLFISIRKEYVICEKQLQFHQVGIKKHLRQLLLPLFQDEDDRLEMLLSNPGGEDWKHKDVTQLLKRHLGDSCDLYLGYLADMRDIMLEIGRELSFQPSDTLQKTMTMKPTQSRHAMSKDSIAFQQYRVRFAAGESNRKRLFKELSDLYARLDSLLTSSEKDTELVQRHQKYRVDTAICNFWRTATALFHALAAACQCLCQSQHSADLILQHRAAVETNPEFRILFKTNHGESTGKRVCRTRITERSEDEHGCASLPLAKASPQDTVIKAALQPKSPAGRCRPTTKGPVEFSQPSQTITLTVQNCGEPASLPLGPIKVLCTLIKPSSESSLCKGYLCLPNDERRYYVYTMADDLPFCPDSVSLGQMLASKAPNFRVRCRIALVLASSFVQLVDSPWMTEPHAFDKDSILFLSGKLDEPHIRRAFSTMTETHQNHTDGVSAPLSRLGITLLELCFGTTLQSQELRKSLPSGDTERMRDLFDVTAACEWLKDVAEDRGEDYARAVTWCLVGHRSGLVDRWREEMLRSVIGPLQRCLDYLSGVTGR
ncbi:hypothetical protein PspLS_07619 [Pyricularia sp. CBS 133598]|nr:hypothetical protein PspLS_07619 [Pyricularia sp. CBS 133598]